MIRLLTDSTSDLSPELRERCSVTVLPLITILGEEEHTDGVDITPEELYAWSDRTHQSPKTAVFSVQQAKDCFRSLLGDGDELICFAISEKMSASASVMRLAAQQIHAEDRIHVVDSENLSTGIGLLILAASEFLAQGLSAAETVARVEALRPLVRASFVVDTLTYLHRGGRCSGVVALAGNALRLHPQIVVQDGAMHPDRKYRGSIRHALTQYVTDLIPEMKNARPDRVFITHSGCPDEIVQAVYEKIQSLNHFREIHITRAGGVISSHCGPNTLGVLFIDRG